VTPSRARVRDWLALAAVLVALVGCSGVTPPGPGATQPPPSVSGPNVSLTVFAASSLKDVFTALGDAWDQRRQMRYSFDSSSALAAQIQQGAPGDIFASADTKNPDALVAAGLTLGPSVPFAGNTLVIIVPADNPAYIGKPADLANPGVRIVAAGPDVPITKYADQAVANLAKLSGFPAGYAASVGANVVSHEDNVAAVVAKIALGEGDAAIVYATDAKTSKQVTAIPIPADANVTATYAAVALTSGTNQSASPGFLDWLKGPVAQAILADHGFLPPP
jgi:molybdate transport system substrate-binding protein